MPNSTLYTNAIPNHFEQVAVSDSSGSTFTAIAGQPGKYIKVWRWKLTVSDGGNLGFSSSGGRVLDPAAGGTGTSTQWSVMDFPPVHAFVPWVETDIGEGLNLIYNAGTANGIITYTVESVQ